MVHPQRKRVNFLFVVKAKVASKFHIKNRADVQLLVAIVNNVFVDNLTPHAQSAIATHAMVVSHVLDTVQVKRRPSLLDGTTRLYCKYVI